MRITVIIPTWRRVEKLRACLESLEKQQSPPEEVIVTLRFDDDGTRDFLAEWCTKSVLNYHLLTLREPGVVHAENQAIAYVREKNQSDVVTFMDDDAVAHPDWIRKIKTFFQDHTEAAALGGPDVIATEPWTYHDRRVKSVGVITVFGKVIGNHHHKSEGLREVDVLKGVNMSFRAQYLRALDSRLQGLDPAKGNGVFWELDLCLTVKTNGGKIYFDPALLITHDSNHGHFIKDAVVASTAHNLTYLMLKHLPHWRRPLFLLYSCLVGNGHVHGLVKTTVECLRQRSLKPLHVFRISMTGVLGGLRLSLLGHP